MRTIRTITAEGIHISLGSSELVAPLPQPLPEGATDVQWVPEENALNYFVDEVPFTMDITEADLAAALAYEPPAPIPPVPESVNRKDFFLAAATVPLLKSDMQAAIDGITDPQTRTLAQIEFDESQRFLRAWPLLEQMAVGFGITSEQLDDLFRLAKSYEGRSALA